mgnify:FL=1
MIAKRRKHHWLIALLVFGVTVWPGIDARGAGAGDPELEATAQGLAEQIATLRTEKDSSAMAEALRTFVRVHNELESKTLRHDLQHAVGKVLKDRRMGAARELAAEALGQIDDPKGGYNHLKRMLPSRKTEEVTPLELAVLRSVGNLRRDSAIKTLLELMAKAKDREVSKEAISALGGYGGSKRRVTILKELVTYMQRTQPHYTPGKRISQAARERWNVLRGPLLSALNRLTGQQLSSPEDWASLYRSNKRNLKVLFSDE